MSDQTKERASYLASVIIEDGLSDPDEDVSEDTLEIVNEGISGLLGDRLDEVEAFRRELPEYPGGPSVEEVVVSMIGRVSEITR